MDGDDDEEADGQTDAPDPGADDDVADGEEAFSETPAMTSTTPMKRPGLSRSALVAYFLNNAAATLPLTAFTVWLNGEIAMPFDTQARYYALLFLPWSLKPIMSLASERLPIRGRRRAPYAVIGSVGFAVSLAMTALFEWSIPMIFFWGVARSASEALSECVLGLVLVDHVEQHGADTARDVQASSNGARIVGSIVAYAVGFALYGCTAGHDATSWSPRAVFLATSLIPLASAFASLFLPDPIDGSAAGSETIADALDDVDIIRDNDEEAESRPTEANVDEELLPPVRDDGSDDLGNIVLVRHAVPTWLVTAGGVGLVQFTVIWAGVENLVASREAFATVMVLSSLSTLAMVLAMLRRDPSLAFAIFLFTLNAVPTPDTAWYGFVFDALTPHPECRLQILDTIAQFSNLGACFVYPSIARRLFAGSSERALAGTVVLSSLAQTAFDMPPAASWRTFIPNGFDGFSPLAYFAVSGLVCDALGRVASLSQQVVATERSLTWKREGISPGVVYGIVTSVLDFGESASGWLSAPLISAAGVKLGRWDNLWMLVLIRIMATLCVVTCMPGLLLCPAGPKRVRHPRRRPAATTRIRLTAVAAAATATAAATPQ